MISRGDEQASGWPVVNLLKKHCDEPLEFTNVRIVIAPLRNRIQCVEQKYAVDALCVVENMAKICPRTPEKTAHDRRKVQCQQWPVKLVRDPARSQCLTYAGRTGEHDRTRRRQAFLD